MSLINAAITAVGGYLPEDKLTNADLEKLVDTNDEWIMTRVGIRERRILKDPAKGASYLGVQAVKDLLSRNEIDPATIDGIILATNTADYHFPTTASIVAYETGCVNASPSTCRQPALASSMLWRQERTISARGATSASSSSLLRRCLPSQTIQTELPARSSVTLPPVSSSSQQRRMKGCSTPTSVPTVRVVTT